MGGKQIFQDTDAASEIRHENHAFIQSIAIIILILIFIVMGVFIGYVLGKNKNDQSNSQAKNINQLITPVPSPSGMQFLNSSQQSSDTAASWTIYTDVNFSVKYPVNWLLKKGFASNSDIIIYDPKSIQQVTQNGTQSRIPTVYLDVLSVTDATQSAAKIVEGFANTMRQKNITIQSEESPVYKSDMVLFDNPGGTGKNIVWSHNNMEAMFNSSAQHLSDNSIENQILQTFQFAQPKQQ